MEILEQFYQWILEREFIWEKESRIYITDIVNLGEKPKNICVFLKGDRRCGQILLWKGKESYIFEFYAYEDQKRREEKIFCENFEFLKFSEQVREAIEQCIRSYLATYMLHYFSIDGEKRGVAVEEDVLSQISEPLRMVKTINPYMKNKLDLGLDFYGVTVIPIGSLSAFQDVILSARDLTGQLTELSILIQQAIEQKKNIEHEGI